MSLMLPLLASVLAVDQAFQLVYQIKTSVDAAAPKASYGSGFVVGEDGVVATNFHVVATALHEPAKYKVYLVDGDETLDARVTHVNAVNDLALLKVERRFPRAIRPAATPPRIGDTLYSLGLPEDLNKSIVEGSYNGVIAEGPYRKIQMTMALNAGMSGGPTVNAAGELVGVNVSVLLFAQDVAFAVPAALVAELEAAPARTYEKKDGINTLDAELERQLGAVQKDLVAEIEKAAASRLALPGFSAAKPPAFLKCWRTREDGPRQRWEETTEECFLGNAGMIDGRRYAGTFQVVHKVVEAKRLNAWQLWNQVARRAGGGPAGRWTEDVTTRFACDALDVVNAYGMPLRVDYCLSAFVRMQDLYELDFRIVTTAPGRRALTVSGYYAGFDAAGARRILELTVDGIKGEDSKNDAT